MFMKRMFISLFSFFIFSIIGLHCTAQYHTGMFGVYKPFHTATVQSVLKDGIYNASVAYSSSTGQRSNYTLKVKISNDSVVLISFDNGGSIHSGFNNEGYTYNGGALRFIRSYTGEITGASTVVEVRYINGLVQQFQIEL